MRIATVQIASRLGDVEGNIKRADGLLKGAGVGRPGQAAAAVGIEEAKLDILVLPELAFTGYNFPSLEAIKPFLEPSGKGPSAAWACRTARRLGCKVCVGYPEVEVEVDQYGESKEKYYNSLLVVDEEGNVLLNYRKTFLYYTDETWASEGSAELGFHQLTFPEAKKSTSSSRARAEGEAAILPPPPSGGDDKVGKEIATSFGICMDINPYRFEAPYTAYEFAHRVLNSNTQLVILSMAWLTLMSREELNAQAKQPELDTFNYWIQRFMPLLREKMGHSVNAGGNKNGNGNGTEKKIIIVFANRAGEEEGSESPPSVARYAGTSNIVAISQRQRPGSEGGHALDDEQLAPLDVKILCWDMLGAAEEGVCFADTGADPKMVFQLARADK
ncbi:carbon-nitrogen hydrolase [Aspergillus varians]